MHSGSAPVFNRPRLWHASGPWWHGPRGGATRRGGYRVIYAVFRKYGKIVLVTLFPKSEQANLSKAGQNLVATLLREIERELDQVDREQKAGTIMRGSHHGSQEGP